MLDETSYPTLRVRRRVRAVPVIESTPAASNPPAAQKHPMSGSAPAAEVRPPAPTTSEALTTAPRLQEPEATLLAPLPAPVAARPQKSADYDVGYGKPPKASRFAKGRSGNPKGRPKASRNARTIITEAVFKMRDVTVDGKKVRMSQFEIGFQQIMKKFMTGDPKAAALLINLLAKVDELGGGPSVSEGHAVLARSAMTDSNMRMLTHFQSTLLQDAGLADDEIHQLLAEAGFPVSEAPDHDNHVAAGQSESSNGLAEDDDLAVEDDEEMSDGITV